MVLPRTAFTIILLSVLLLASCEGDLKLLGIEKTNKTLHQANDDLNQRIQEAEVQCHPPYIEKLGTCCLDVNKNNLCDSTESQPAVPTTERPPQNNPPTQSIPIVKPTPTIPQISSECRQWTNLLLPETFNVYFRGNTIDQVALNEKIYENMDSWFYWADGSRATGQGWYARGMSAGQNVNKFYLIGKDGKFKFAKNTLDSRGNILGVSSFEVRIDVLNPLDGSTSKRSPREPVKVEAEKYELLSCTLISGQKEQTISSIESVVEETEEQESLPNDGSSCSSDTDCDSGYCADEGDWKGPKNICRPAHCNDNKESGDESDVNCGGSCTLCDVKKSCNKPADCKSGKCCDNSCSDWFC